MLKISLSGPMVELDLWSILHKQHVCNIDESKRYITNQYHSEHYGLYPIAGKYFGWQ